MPRDWIPNRPGGRCFFYPLQLYHLLSSRSQECESGCSLSRLHSPEEVCEEPETIIPKEIIVSPIQWNPESDTPSNVSTPTLPGCPPGLQYITRARRTPLIHSVHTSLGTGHPGANGTLSLLKDRFWWPNMARDVRRFEQGCSDCAVYKSPRHLPSGFPRYGRPFSISFYLLPSAHHQLQRAVRRMTADLQRSEAPNYQPGQKVWLSTREIQMHLPCKKLSPRYVGPFTITKQINPVTYQFQLPPQYRIHPSFHVSLLKPYHSPVSPSTESGPTEEPPLPLILEDGTIYKVNEILDSRCRGGQLEYLVDWEGYGLEELSWVPRNDILDPTLLEEFHSAHPDRPAPWGKGRPPRCRGPRPSGAGHGGGGTVMD